MGSHCKRAGEPFPLPRIQPHSFHDAAGAAKTDRMNQATRILTALVLGLIAGIAAYRWGGGFTGQAVAVAEPVGGLWLDALRMTIVPLIVSLLITGIAAGAEAARSSKLAGRAIVLFFAVLWSSAIISALLTPALLGVFPMLCIVVWLAQRFQSPGPLFHVQTRAGMQNRQFKILKFRTMHAHNGDVARQAKDGDSRVYGLGRWFRKLSIDEVPQFWNVLKGDMSIVGPRPHLIEHNNQFSQLMANYLVRAFVKPGITGLAQVRGYRGEAKNQSDIKNRVECDIEYLENWNLSLECGIILRTCAQIIVPPRTAY